MHKERAKKISKFTLKIILLIIVYVFFLIYTPTIYGASKNFVTDLLEEKKVIIVSDTIVKAKVADTHDERIIGLSQTETLKENHGMFFIFEEEDFHGIWMKEMNFAIDIIWFDSYGSIIHIKENVGPETYPEVFESNKKSLYILEVNAGFVEKNGLKIGDTIDLY